MKTIIIGIDGLEKDILNKYIDQLPSFKKILEIGTLKKIESVFPADSVPAWISIFTGLNPSEHGYIRGKDYVESLDHYEDKKTISLEGNTFWDKINKKGYSTLVINPYLAYPVWETLGAMAAGPAYIEGKPSFSGDIKLIYPQVLGGYQPVSDIKYLKKDMTIAYNETEKLCEEFQYQRSKKDFDLSFLTITTLDRIQHYTWRYFDESDPLYKKDDFLSDFILRTLKLLDNFLWGILKNMSGDEQLIIISDHGFGQRPYQLINLNELLRQKGLLHLKGKNSDSGSKKRIQKIKNKLIKTLTKYQLIDKAKTIANHIPFFSKYKKSEHLIDKESSELYVDEFFNGKKPYCGLRFGERIRDNKKKTELISKFLKILSEENLPQPLWIKESHELYSGKYHSNLPDICFELPKEFGIEFNLFDKIMTTSFTHYKISGGHLGAGTLGYYSKKKKLKNNELNSIMDFHEFVVNSHP